MKKVPNKTVSERTPVLPFRDRNVSEVKGQKDSQLRQDKTVQRIKGPAQKVELSAGTAAEPANTLAPVLPIQIGSFQPNHRVEPAPSNKNLPKLPSAL